MLGEGVDPLSVGVELLSVGVELEELEAFLLLSETDTGREREKLTWYFSVNYTW